MLLNEVLTALNVKEYSLLECDAMQCRVQVPVFWSNYQYDPEDEGGIFPKCLYLSAIYGVIPEGCGLPTFLLVINFLSFLLYFLINLWHESKEFGRSCFAN